GTGNYTFTLGGDAAATQTQPGAIYRFNNLSAGNYTIDLEDANSCSIVQQNVTLTEPVALTATAAITSNFNGAELSCFGASDGEITTTAGNGSGGYTYVLNEEPTNTTGDANGIYTGLAAGSYTVTVTDNNGCSATTTSIVIDNPVDVDVTAAASNISCNAAGDGSVTGSSSGGTGTLVYDLEDDLGNAIANTTGDASGTYTALAAGTYRVRVTDDNGCTSTSNNVVVSEPAVLSASTT
ncbi:hypothetical protein JKA74_20675, partial [Marivirga sp. S37H4]|nr:hypothetical protein [Marivirga aurantiaca]